MLHNVFVINSFKLKLRIIGEFGHTFGIVGKPLLGFNEGHLKKKT
jgi:hypothetical protein